MKNLIEKIEAQSELAEGRMALPQNWKSAMNDSQMAIDAMLEVQTGLLNFTTLIGEMGKSSSDPVSKDAAKLVKKGEALKKEARSLWKEIIRFHVDMTKMKLDEKEVNP